MTNEPAWTKLALGADVVQLLLPHRRPFLLVDGVDAVFLGDKAMLRAHKMIPANEPVFEGHFPGLSLWPGVYTIEGLGQCCNLLTVLLGVAEAARREGIPAEAFLDALRALEKRVRPGGSGKSHPDDAKLLAALGEPRSRIGFAGAIDVKLIEPVLAGSVVEYRVGLTHVIANAKRFEVEARVSDRPVARGNVTSATP